MIKILLCSDNHGDYDSISKILNANPNCDYYFHCGDALIDKDKMSPFLVVRGNNDYFYDYDPYRIIDIRSHKILLIHGTNYTYNLDSLADLAKQKMADTVFFGHTHQYLDTLINGIRLINPGSCYYNRDFTPASYARIYIDDDDMINAFRVDI